MIKQLATIFLVFVYSTVLAQAHPENFAIMNVETGLVLEVESGCNLNPGNTTDGIVACGVRLVSFSEGRKSQLWKITEDNGFLYIQSVPFAQYLKASTNLAIISKDNTPFFFKPVRGKDGNYLLLQGTVEKDENGHSKQGFTYNTLQASGTSVHFAAFDEKQDIKQSWKFVPVKEKAPDLTATNNQTLTKEWSDAVSNMLTPKTSAKDLVEQAKTYKKNKNYDEAIKLLQQAITLEPNNDTANIELAGTYWDKKDLANATLFAEKAKSLNPNNELTWNLLGLIARDQQQWEKAISYFQTVVEINPSANISFANLAFCYDNAGKNNEAIANYTKAIDVTMKLGYQPESYLYNNRGWVYRKMNKINEAIADFRKALEINPNNAMAKANLDAALKLQQQNTTTTITLDAYPNTQTKNPTTTNDPNQGKGDYYQTCRVCCGLGKVNNDGYLEACPECEGKGKVPVGHNYVYITKCK
ncbi:MAG TPA: tetratricopeptide repeat protein [Chitinophagaceae bacterium]|nr:tetratricopeptide repeat protein [Chitinophagaceae bacterium]